MDNTVSRNMKNSTSIFAPTIANGLVLLLTGAYYLFSYVPRPSTEVLAKTNTNTRKNT
jgi:hypothetical protein